MNYYDKYLKYKNKYLELKNQDGGFIKGDKIEREYTRDTYKFFTEKLDEQMPLCYFDSTKTNFILINNNNYILINKKENDDYELYQLNITYDIVKIEKPHEMIEDDIQFPGISQGIYVDIINSYVYHNDNIFRKFFSEVWTTDYSHFNRLKDIMYKKSKRDGQILYQNNMNIVLASIFMKNITTIFNKSKEKPIKEDKEKYYFFEKTKINKNFNEIKTGILYDYISRDDLFSEQDLNVETFENIKINLNKILSNIESLDFTKEDIIEDFILFMKIFEKIYSMLYLNDYMIDQYNYLLYIHKYKNFNNIEDERTKDTNYKSLKSFINSNKYNRNSIKNKLAINLTSLSYLIYKTNIEIQCVCYIKDELFYCTKRKRKLAEYMILDYFWGISKIINPCIPINKREFLIILAEKWDSDKLRRTPITDEREKEFYNFLNQKFKEIKQYTFSDPIKYSDCGETTILNIFNYFLLKEDGTFDLSDSDSWDIKLKEFYTKYPTMQSMTKQEIYISLKKDLSLVFNKRGDKIIYNKEQCDIHTTMTSIIKTCCFLLGIETTNFIDIFKKLNKNVKNEDVEVKDEILKYSNIFRLELYEGHGEFNLLLNDKKIYDQNLDSLNHHWISFHLPEKYSLEHFKFFLEYVKDFFLLLPEEIKKNEELCLAAIDVNSKTFIYIDEKKDPFGYIKIAVDNFEKIINKTDKICKVAFSISWKMITKIPKNLLTKELSLIAFNQDIPKSYYSILNIPLKFQDKEMINKINESTLEDKDKEQLLSMLKVSKKQEKLDKFFLKK